ncbi:site-specific integrase [Halobacterium sp. R2-5]|uniref:tyrosine-type recombinase/integrase n=1 Tax=Halobacterium sp. R2-5 TaxID=2715751 RepID=UPI0014201130|nr:site-specific integrase [Halobacterium sp. R2-5]NIC00272.1 tyrosine-type recombinase/integrase [Halobacterium sp. R2-5]
MNTDKSDLEPLDPEMAAELFLEHKATDCTEATVQNHRSRMKHFLEWCDEEDIDNLNDLSGRDLQRYRLWLADNEDLNAVTMKNMTSGFRVFLKWAGSMEAVPEDLYTKLMIPRVRRSQQSNEDILEAERAEELLTYLSQYKYASMHHVLLALLWETGMRMGAAYSIDLTDVDFDEERIELVHRPEAGTTLKNGKSGERFVAISSELSEMLDDHVDVLRHDVTDDHGRDPLLTTSQGRMSRGWMRRKINQVTAPCYLNEPCPDCEQGTDRKCPEAVSPHAIRRGSITHFLTEDVPTEIVSDRMNVSRKVLDKHYDKRSKEVKLEQRRGYLDEI